MFCPRKVEAPAEAPSGLVNPFGEGFVRLATYVWPLSSDDTSAVDELKPIWFTFRFVTPSGAKKIPYPPRSTVVFVKEYANPNRGMKFDHVLRHRLEDPFAPANVRPPATLNALGGICG